jgi:transposase
MNVREREPGDLNRLRAAVRREREARRRDRLRAVQLALEGRDAPAIAMMLGRSRRTVQQWVYAYRDGGLDAIHPPNRQGRQPFLAREREAELMARLDAGPRPEDGVCTLRGRDVLRILQREFGVRYSLQGAYDLLHRLGYSSLRPRPRHEKNNPAAMKKFRKAAPLLSAPSAAP